MIKRSAENAVFVSRKTMCERLEIGQDTLDTWLRSGFIPGPNINRGQIQRWHWPSIEDRLSERSATTAPDPYMEDVRLLGEDMARRKLLREENRARNVREKQERAEEKANSNDRAE